MLPHPLLATDDDATAIVRSIERLPELLDHFFACLETVYIDTNDSDASEKLNTAYINIQWHMLLLDRVPSRVFMTRRRGKGGSSNNNGASSNSNSGMLQSLLPAAQSSSTQPQLHDNDNHADNDHDAADHTLVRDTKMPLLLHRLTRLFLDDVIGVGPQALTWKRPCQRVARECAEHIRSTVVVHFPPRMRTRRRFVTYDSFAFVLLLAACVAAVAVAAVVLIAQPAAQVRRDIGLPIACVAVLLLAGTVCCLLVHFVAAARALQLLYNDVFAIQVACGGGIDHWLAYARQRGALSTALARRGEVAAAAMATLRGRHHTSGGGGGGGGATTTTTTTTTSTMLLTAMTTTADATTRGSARGTGGGGAAAAATAATAAGKRNEYGVLVGSDGLPAGSAMAPHAGTGLAVATHNNNNSNGVGGGGVASAYAVGGLAHAAAGGVVRSGYYALLYGKDDRVGFIDGRNIDAQLVMIAYDSNSFVITRWNSAAEAMTGFLADGCVGKPLSELVMRSNGGDICDELRSARRGTLIKIKLRTLATAPVAVFTMVTPIVDAREVVVGSVLVCASPKDDLREYRCYIHNFQVTEASEALSLLLHRHDTTTTTAAAAAAMLANSSCSSSNGNRHGTGGNSNNSSGTSHQHGSRCTSSLSPHDVALVTATRTFLANCSASRVEELAREMITVWEWTTVEQIVGRALGNSNNSSSNSNNTAAAMTTSNTNSVSASGGEQQAAATATSSSSGGEGGGHIVHVDPLFPQTLCISPVVSKVIAAVVSATAPSRCTVTLQMLNLTSTVFALSVTVWHVDGKQQQQSQSQPRRWDSEQLSKTLRPQLRSCAGSLYVLDNHVTMHFPCQVAAILEDTDASSSSSSFASDTLLVLTQARAVINCSVNVVTAVSNMVDQHNLSLILLKTMFVSLASVRERGDLEQRLSARPCDVDVVICDSEWLRTSRDILFGGDHGAIVVPCVDDATPLSQEFAYVMRMPLVGRDVQQVMIHVGKQVAMKKNAAAALKEREHILTLRQDSPWTRGRLLGRGSYGAVYEATSDLTGGRMAVKMFYFAANSDALITQLLNEIKIMCSLNHPNIVHYFHCERRDNEVNLFMELCDCSLSDLMGGRHAKPLRLTVTQILRQVLSAVAYLHSRGIAHRDIKPQNILLKGDAIKLTDFGTARKGDVMREVQGTFRYMAPEVYKGMPHTLSCDVWSFGCLVCELFACPTPFMEHAYLLGEMTSAAPHLEHVPQNALLRDLLYRCFRVDSAARPSSQELLTHALLACDATFAEVDHLPTVFTQPARTRAAAANMSAFSISSQ